MSIRAKYEQPSNVSALYNAPRTIAGQQHNLTDTGAGLYATQEQACNLLGVSEKTYRDHLEAEYADVEASQSSRGGVLSPPLYLTVLVTQTNTVSISATGNGGGLQTIKLYNLELVVRVATRTRNTPEKQAIINEMIALYSQYQHAGFVINDLAVHTDQSVALALHSRISAFNFSSERFAMLELNKRIDMLFFSCQEALKADGSPNYGLHSYFRRCCHNTAHIATTGLSALQIIATRADPTQLSFGQQNFRGINAPRNNELNNACNFLTSFELIGRSGIVDRNLGWLMTEVQSRGKLPMHEMLCKFTKYSTGGPFLAYISDDWQDYPETALSNILNMLDTSGLRVEFKLKVEQYKANFPNRHRMTEDQRREFNALEQSLVNDVLNMTTDGNLAEYYQQVNYY